jgi:hypothetical protein
MHRKFMPWSLAPKGATAFFKVVDGIARCFDGAPLSQLLVTKNR